MRIIGLLRAHKLIYRRDIGFPASTCPGITDSKFQGWPDLRSGTLTYGSLFANWLAQAECGQGSDPVDNAEIYSSFVLNNYLKSEKGVNPTSFKCVWIRWRHSPFRRLTQRMLKMCWPFSS